MVHKILPLSVFFVLQTAARGQEFFNTTPQPIKSNFTCVGRMTGYYADLPSNCRVYHNCDDQGNKFSYYCPEMTAFRQEALICDHAHLVDCQAGTRIGKKSQEPRKNLDQSTPSTTRPADRWTTANPFRDFLLNTNLTVRDKERTRTTDSTSKIPGANSFGFHFGTSSGFGSNQEESKNLRNDRPSLTSTDQNRTRFFGNTLERLVKSKEVSLKTKTGDDQLTLTSRSQFAWNNHGGDFGGHPKVKFNDRHVESTTSHSVFGQSRTTKSYFDFKNSDYVDPDKAGVKSWQIPVPTSLRTPPTTPSTRDIPLQDFTASLKPLVPNTLEYDPYYPGESWTSTESYYTPGEEDKLPRALEAPNFEPSIFGVYFKIPETWPDFNTLDDIVDRRKLFYIPKSRKFR